MKITTLLTGLLAFFTLSASAATITLTGTPVIGEGQATSVEDAVTINFNDGTAPTSGPIQYTYSSSNIVSGSLTGVYLAPTGDMSKYLSVGPTSGNNVVIDFNIDVDYFGFYAGSLDSYNLIQFYSASGLVLSLTGTDIEKAVGRVADTYVNIFAADSSEYFTQIRISSSSNAFETDNHAFRAAAGGSFDPNPSEVPEPTTFMMMAPAVAAIAYFRRKRA